MFIDAVQRRRCRCLGDLGRFIHLLRHFVLNVFQRGVDNAEAQQAFFAAVAGEPDQPDYLFNLAVSLERLRQPGAAPHYSARAKNCFLTAKRCFLTA